MNDTDRILATSRRVLTDGCTNCNMSKVYCRCVAWIEGDPARCCTSCSH